MMQLQCMYSMHALYSAGIYICTCIVQFGCIHVHALYISRMYMYIHCTARMYVHPLHTSGVCTCTVSSGTCTFTLQLGCMGVLQVRVLPVFNEYASFYPDISIQWICSMCSESVSVLIKLTLVLPIYCHYLVGVQWCATNKWNHCNYIFLFIN